MKTEKYLEKQEYPKSWTFVFGSHSNEKHQKIKMEKNHMIDLNHQLTKYENKLE